MRYLLFVVLLAGCAAPHDVRPAPEAHAPEVQWIGDGWIALEHPKDHFVIFFRDEKALPKAVETICKEHHCTFASDDIWQAQILDRTPKPLAP